MCGKIRIKIGQEIPKGDDIMISHGMCPDCFEKEYGDDMKDLADEERGRNALNQEIWVEDRINTEGVGGDLKIRKR